MKLPNYISEGVAILAVAGATMGCQEKPRMGESAAIVCSDTSTEASNQARTMLGSHNYFLEMAVNRPVSRDIETAQEEIKNYCQNAINSGDGGKIMFSAFSGAKPQLTTCKEFQGQLPQSQISMIKDNVSVNVQQYCAKAEEKMADNE